MQTNSWYHKLFHFHLSFWIWKVWKGREKMQKFEYLENEKSFFDEIKNNFYSFRRAIIWWKNKNFIKIADASFKAQSKNVFVSCKSHVPFLRYSRFYTISSTSKVVTSWCVLAHEVEYIFEFIFWIVNHLIMKLGKLPHMGNIFKKYFAWFVGLGPKSRPLIIYQPTTIYRKTNY